MAKLKTLKEIEVGKLKIKQFNNQEFIAIGVLRQEAIKHHKKLVDCEYHTEPMTAYEWIEEFFDITEEDLKCNR